MLPRAAGHDMDLRVFGGFDEHRDRFEAVICDILEDEPDGLLAHELRERVQDHSRFNVRIDRREFSLWLEDASNAIVVRDPENPWNYLASEHLEEREAEAGA